MGLMIPGYFYLFIFKNEKSPINQSIHQAGDRYLDSPSRSQLSRGLLPSLYICTLIITIPKDSDSFYRLTPRFE